VDEVAVMVAPDPIPGRVAVGAVDLHDQLVLVPDGVDEEAVHVGVALRQWQVVGLAEEQEAAPEPAAGRGELGEVAPECGLELRAASGALAARREGFVDLQQLVGSRPGRARSAGRRG
jgi:hypothetical protein